MNIVYYQCSGAVTILPALLDPKKKTMNNLDDRWRTEVRKQDSVMPKQKGLSSLTRIPYDDANITARESFVFPLAGA